MEGILIGLGVIIIVGVIAYFVINAIRGGQKGEIEKRLERYTEGVFEEVSVEPSEPVTSLKATAVVTDRVGRAVEGRGFAENIRTQLAQANLKITVGEYLSITFVCVVLFAAVAHLVRQSAILTLGAGLAGFFGPRIYVGRTKSQRFNAFNNQLGDTINLMVNGIRAGYSVLQAMESVAQEMGPPISEEFERVVREVQFGISMEDALDNMLRRVPSDDLDLTITAIKVQREVGGNLAEVLDAISFTIRERVRIKGEIRALTAMGRGSGTMISILPLAVIGFLSLVNPTFIGPMFEDPCGWIMLSIGGIMIASGYFLIQKMTDIEV